MTPAEMQGLQAVRSIPVSYTHLDVYKRQPFRAGKSLVVKPTWEPYEAQAGDRIIEIDAGMAFGSGTHETTSMCLDFLEDYLTPGARVIDVGTGSGILAIGAALLGAREVLAIDIDPVAVKVAAENVAHNGLEGCITCVQGNLLDQRAEHCDLCVANIIADVICGFAAPLKDHITPCLLYTSVGCYALQDFFSFSICLVSPMFWAVAGMHAAELARSVPRRGRQKREERLC